MDYQSAREKVYAVMESVRPIFQKITKVPEPGASGINFARLRFYSGWAASVSLFLAHILAEYALSDVGFWGIPNSHAEWWNPIRSIQEIITPTNSFVTTNFLTGTGYNEALVTGSAITLARLFFWLGIIATITYVALRFFIKENWQAASANVSLEYEMKKCPSCAERIRFEAIKCRFCGHPFDPEEVEKAIEARLQMREASSAKETKPANTKVSQRMYFREEAERYKAEAQKLREELAKKQATSSSDGNNE